MKRNRKLSSAIIAILGVRAAAVSAADQDGSRGTSSIEIPGIVVTAQRRSESAQDVPITLQALTGEALTQLNVTTFEDYVKYLPNVTFAGAGPGQNNIYMRGLATSTNAIQGSGAVGSFPNVAVYLDEQSGQLPERNLDVYAADIERIEVLEGPQGTLFGAGAQAGVVRYITNKPKLNVSEGAVNAGYAITSGGNPSTNLDATLNIPVIADMLAVRAVVYDESRGGYINNIPATFGRAPSDQGIVNYFGGVVPKNSGPISNAAVVGNAINPVVYKGLRVSGLLQLNEDWSTLIAQSYQQIDADGVFWDENYDGLGHPLPHMAVQIYNPSYNHDKFENTQLTINGRIGDLSVIYAGGYLDRSVGAQTDYTNYSRGTYADYYQCNYPGYPFIGGKSTPGSPGYCYSPSEYWQDHQKSSHQSHEIRLSTLDSWRVRALGGLFYENYEIHEQTDWFMATSPNFVPTVPPMGATSNNPSVRPVGESFFDDITRGYKQKAVFGSVDVDIIPKALTLTLGSRYYRIEDFEVGSDVGSFGCEIYGPYNGRVPAYPCGIPQSNGNNLDARNLDKTYHGFKSRANITGHAGEHAMIYYTWSQGFRPGGFNRAQSVIKPTSPLYGLFTPPLAFGPDTLTNNELGWKTEWLGHSLQWNGAMYQEDWKDTQISIFDPGVTGNLTFSTNGPDYRVRGAETSIVARVTQGLTVTASAAWNRSQEVKTLSLRHSALWIPSPVMNYSARYCRSKQDSRQRSFLFPTISRRRWVSATGSRL